MRAGRATGWPVTAWFSPAQARPAQAAAPRPRRRGPPAHRPGAHLGAGAPPRCSGPASTPRCARSPTTSPPAWPGPGSSPYAAPRWRACPSSGDRLDGALADTDLGAARTPVWAGAVRVLQWLLLAAALVGGLWLLALAGAAFLQLPRARDPAHGRDPGPDPAAGRRAWSSGCCSRVVCRFLVSATARRRARVADQRLRRGGPDRRPRSSSSSRSRPSWWRTRPCGPGWPRRSSSHRPRPQACRRASRCSTAPPVRGGPLSVLCAKSRPDHTDRPSRRRRRDR